MYFIFVVGSANLGSGNDDHVDFFVFFSLLLLEIYLFIIYITLFIITNYPLLSILS